MRPLLRLKDGALFGAGLRIERLLRESPQGSVYEVERQSDQKRFNLRLLPIELIQSDELKGRLIEASKVAGRLTSDHVPQIVEAGVDEASGIPWLLSEPLAGEDLESLLRKNGPLSLPEVRELLAQLGHALGAGLKLGLVHGSIKPKNIWLAPSRSPSQPFHALLLDFGLAQLLREIESAEGGVGGSPQWLAPELIDGKPPTPTSDVWTLGLLLFRLLTGSYYLREANRKPPVAMSIVREVLLDEQPAASARAEEYGAKERLPPGFDTWFARCCRHDTKRRFPDAEAAISALLDVLDGKELPPEPTETEGPVESPPQAPEASIPAARVPTAPRPPDRRGIRALVLGMCVLAIAAAAVAGVAMYQQHAARSECESDESVSFERMLVRAHACEGLCARGSVAHCVRHGVLTLSSRLEGDQSSNVARRIFRAACNQKSGAACLSLALLLEEGRSPGLSPDREAATQAYIDACERGERSGCAGAVRLLLRTGATPREEALAFHILERGCAASGIRDCARLGQLLAVGRGAPSDLRRAELLLSQGCAGGIADACSTLAERLMSGQGIPADAVRAADLFRRACEKQDAAGCSGLARALRTGQGLPRDELRAATLFKHGCEQGRAADCYELALMYQGGVGVSQDRGRGADLLERACRGGERAACSRRKSLEEPLDAGKPARPEPGGSHERPEKRRPAERSPETSANILQACKLGDVAACLFLKGPPPSISKELPGNREPQGQQPEDPLRAACSRGEAAACAELARRGASAPPSSPQLEVESCGDAKTCLKRAREARSLHPPDMPRAVRWLTQSCEQRSAEACHELGVLFANGDGLLRSPKRAADLYNTACELGLDRACSALMPLLKEECQAGRLDRCIEAGQRYQSGRGVPRERGAAEELFRRACSGGDATGCRLLKQLQSMPPTQDV